MKRQSTQPAPKLPEIGDDEKTLIRDSGVHEKFQIDQSPAPMRDVTSLDWDDDEEATDIFDTGALVEQLEVESADQEELQRIADATQQRCGMIIPPKSEVPTYWRDQGNDQ